MILKQKIIILLSVVTIIFFMVGCTNTSDSVTNTDDTQLTISNSQKTEFFMALENDSDYQEFLENNMNFEPTIEIYTHLTPADYKELKKSWEETTFAGRIQFFDTLDLTSSTKYVEVSDTLSKDRLVLVYDENTQNILFLLRTISVSGGVK